jgi:hypothetical protein
MYLNARHETKSNIITRKLNLDILSAVKIDILKALFTVLDTFNSMEDKWFAMKKLIMNIFNEHAPLVSPKFRSSKHHAWFDDELRCLALLRDKAHRQLQRALKVDNVNENVDIWVV